MRLTVDYYKFPKQLDGGNIGKGERYYVTVEVADIEDERELALELYKILTSITGVPRDQLKIMGWTEED